MSRKGHYDDVVIIDQTQNNNYFYYVDIYVGGEKIIVNKFNQKSHYCDAARIFPIGEQTSHFVGIAVACYRSIESYSRQEIYYNV